MSTKAQSPVDSSSTVSIGGLKLPVAITGLPRANPYMDMDDYDPEGDLLSINLGPQHPSTHGVLRVKLWMDGEVCIKAVPYLGYLHRGVEKLCEKLTYVQITPIVDKNDYVAPMTNELAVNMAFEKLIDAPVPPRAQVIRTINAELQRIASHLLSVGTWCLDMGGALGGGASAFLYTFRERELILDLFEDLTGCRFHYNHHTVGGIRHDLPEGWQERVKGTLNVIESRIGEYRAMLDENHIFKSRTVGVGILDPVLAMELGISGPNLRASGVDHDLRRDAPYAAYDRVDVRVPIASEGDCYARYQVRMAELEESIRIVRCLIDDIPDGPICGLKAVKLPGAVKAKGPCEVYTSIESPRGELGTWVLGQKGPHPYRLKIRPPSLHAVAALPWICPGHNLSDVVVILGSLDPILGEVDR
jgi:NADH-quinone oxidoreductase subunit D